jgi:hypothetical protein
MFKSLTGAQKAGIVGFVFGVATVLFVVLTRG